MFRFRLAKAYPWFGRVFRPWVISNTYEAIAFFNIHRRLPAFQRTRLFNDYLFKIRALESDYVFRAFTADKEFSKIFVRGVTGQDLSVPTLAVLRRPDDVGPSAVPDNCVIKPTHMSGEVIFHGTGRLTNDEQARMRRWFRMNFGDMTGERHYQKLEPKIIVEPWLALNGAFCNDYRFFVFDGKTRVIEVKIRASEHEAFSIQVLTDWTPFPGRSSYNPQNIRLSHDELQTLKPGCLARMNDVAEALSKDIQHLRVDFFCDGGDQFYVGELSHVNANVREVYYPTETERLFVSPSQT